MSNEVTNDDLKRVHEWATTEASQGFAIEFNEPFIKVIKEYVPTPLPEDIQFKWVKSKGGIRYMIVSAQAHADGEVAVIEEGHIFPRWFDLRDLEFETEAEPPKTLEGTDAYRNAPVGTVLSDGATKLPNGNWDIYGEEYYSEELWDERRVKTWGDASA